MYKPIGKKGTIQDVQGLPCHTPPEGWIFDHLEKKLVCIGVHKRYYIPEGCYWEPDPRWKDYKKWEAEETEMRERNPAFYHAELSKFKRDMWLRRLGGYWFYNYDKPTYITGVHWYYLSCYHLDIGLPYYREIDREYFYFWDYIVHDPNAWGMVELTKRRNGKSFRAGCIGLESATRLRNFNVGIQSKTDPDAEKFFKKTVLAPYRKLPSFFRPKTSTPQNGRLPSTELKFETSKAVDTGDELSSMIDYMSSTVDAYDGQKLGLYIGDEAGKTKTVSVNDRLDIVKFCLRDESGRIIGKTIHTTTVEREAKKRDKNDDTCDKNFLQMWKDSDHMNKIEGQTVSGMYRFFMPADRTRLFDDDKNKKYGIEDRQRAYDAIISERKRVEGNPRKLANLKRKEPLDEKEAFQADGESCVFDPMKLNDRWDELKFAPPKSLYERGNFEWKIVGFEVEFVPSEKGRFLVSYHPPAEYRNRHIRNGGFIAPDNKEMFCAGIDGYDHRKNTTSSQYRGLSKGAIGIKKKPHPNAVWEYDNGPACIYIERPNSPDTFYKDAQKALFYYGCQALIETQKPGIIHHLDDEGMAAYMAKLPGKNEEGVAATSKTNNFIAELTDKFINYYIHTVNFEAMIEQWFDFDPDNTTKFDIAMAWGYAEMLADATAIKPKNQKSEQTSDIADYFSFLQ